VIDLSFGQLGFDVRGIELDDLVGENEGGVVLLLFERHLVAQAVEGDQLVVLGIHPRSRQMPEQGGQQPALDSGIGAVSRKSLPHLPHTLPMALIELNLSYVDVTVIVKTLTRSRMLP